MDQIPEQLNWVQARHDCSLASEFLALKLDAQKDVDVRNSLRKHDRITFRIKRRQQIGSALWFTDCIENGTAIPEPAPEESLPSGKWIQRVPRTLHKTLIDFTMERME